MKARREFRLGIAAFEKYNKGQKKEGGSSPRTSQEEGDRTSHRGWGAAGGKPEVLILPGHTKPAPWRFWGERRVPVRDGCSPREMAGIDIMLDTVLSDGVDDADDAIGSGGEGLEAGEAEAGDSFCITVMPSPAPQRPLRR